MVAPKYFISYFVVGGYIAAVLAVSLIIALTSSLAGVNRTNCVTTKTVNLNKIVKTSGTGPQEPPKQKQRSIRYAYDEDYAEKIETLKKFEHREPEFKNFKETPTCGLFFFYININFYINTFYNIT